MKPIKKKTQIIKHWGIKSSLKKNVVENVDKPYKVEIYASSEVFYQRKHLEDDK